MRASSNIGIGQSVAACQFCVNVCAVMSVNHLGSLLLLPLVLLFGICSVLLGRLDSSEQQWVANSIRCRDWLSKLLLLSTQRLADGLCCFREWLRAIMP